MDKFAVGSRCTHVVETTVSVSIRVCVSVETSYWVDDVVSMMVVAPRRTVVVAVRVVVDSAVLVPHEVLVK